MPNSVSVTPAASEFAPIRFLSAGGPIGTTQPPSLAELVAPWIV